MFSFRAFQTAVGVMALMAPVMVETDLVSPAQAGSATSWTSQLHAATRLIADTAPWRDQQKALVAGIHIKLDKGWKTYWRYPGDSGFPPRFDWSGSGNLKSAQLLWPAPKRLSDSAGISIGYKNEVVFPVLIEPVTAGQPIDLKLKMEFAVCADICIPAEADLQLKVGKDGFFSRSYAPLLTRYLKRVPGKQPPGSRTGPGVARTQSQLTGAAPYLTVDARFPGGAQGADLFIEGPEGFYLAPAEHVGKRSDGTLRFKVDLTKGDDPKDLKGKTVTLTLVSNAAQAETTWRIE
jgi:DsbC/DsbD-like thiol-disulfide interchange protein